MTFADITTPVDVDELHRRLYAGEIFHFRDLSEMQALVQFTREFLEHAHAGAPNSTELTRLSLETRTVWIPDDESGVGARNVDGAGHWMAPGFFYRVSDGRPLHQILAVQRLEPYVRGSAAASRSP